MNIAQILVIAIIRLLTTVFILHRVQRDKQITVAGATIVLNLLGFIEGLNA